MTMENHQEIIFNQQIIFKTYHKTLQNPSMIDRKDLTTQTKLFTGGL